MSGARGVVVLMSKWGERRGTVHLVGNLLRVDCCADVMGEGEKVVGYLWSLISDAWLGGLT